jgi:hypothetical protein
VGVHGYVYGIALNNWSRVAWAASLPQAGYTIVDVLVYSNRLFAGSNGYVYELNPGNGQVLHQLLVTGSVGTGDYTMRLTASGQTLFAGTHGYVYGINLGNWSGAAWNVSLPNAGYTVVDVLISNNRLFAGSNGYVYELNPGNGQVLHQLLVTGSVGVGDYTTRLAANNQMLFAGVHGYVYGINLSNWSAAAWAADLTGNLYKNANVLSINNQLLAASNGSIYRINPTNGQVVRSVLLTSVVGAGNYETRIVADGQGQTLFAGVHGYAYAVSLNDEHGAIPKPGWGGTPKLKTIGAAQQGGPRGAQIWGVDLNGQLRSAYQTTPGGAWSGWSGVWNGASPQNVIDITAAQQNDGRVQLWALTADNTLYSNYQTAPGGNWSGWTPNWAGAPKLKTIGAAQQGGPRGAQIWGVDLNGQLRSAYQTTPGGAWSGWSGVWNGASPQNAIDITAAQQNDGRVQLWVLTADNTLYSNYQTAPGGNWSGWTP